MDTATKTTITVLDRGSESLLLELDSKVTREWITCDGPDCEQFNPSKRCSRCHTTFYCSQACQKRDWVHEHKKYCVSIDLMRKKTAEPEGIEENVESENADKRNHLKNAINSNCCICTTDPIENPVILRDCRHAFCGPCLINWQSRTKYRLPTLDAPYRKQPVCPLCRAQTDSLEDTILKTARIHFVRALRANYPKPDKQNNLQKAIQEIDKALHDPEISQDCVDLRLLMLKIEILIEAKNGTEALECLDELERINELRMERQQPFMEKFYSAEAA